MVTSPTDILLVDDDPSVIQVLSRALAGLGRLRFATGGREALRRANETAPDLILLDMELPDLSGFEVCKRVKDDPELTDVPVIFVTSHTSAEMEEAGLALGAVDFIAKPIRPAIVAARVRTQLRLKLMTDQLRRMAQTDGLTGVANRRFFDQSLDREWRRARRNSKALSLLMIDVDHFKPFNDHYGHLRGDEALVGVASALQAGVHRPSDLVARYGGEEFAVLLPETDGEGASHIADGLLQAVRALQIPHVHSETGHVTISIGIGCADHLSPGWKEHTKQLGENESQLLLALADESLYRAKHDGRNQVHFQRILADDSLLAGSHTENGNPPPSAA